MRSKILITSILLFSFMLSKAQCFKDQKAFQVGEKISYEAYYNWGLIWIHAGDVSFEVRDGKYKNQSALHFYSYGSSKPSYDWLYKVRDTYQSYITKDTYTPLFFERKVAEGSFWAHDQAYFDVKKGVAFTSVENSSLAKHTDTVAISDCTLDVLSMIYYARNIDFSTRKKGDKIPISMLVEDAVYDLYIQFLGEETIELKTGKSYRCNKFSILLIEGTIFSDGEEMTVWVTDDANKIPVQVEANILVGSIKAVVKDMQGLRHPLNAEIR
ncbi:DUF3108 domain-containing protein [Cytophagales bacterium LB-30]|uniref:DUF3108 domain-containing protein n=1 Tax=Shiella aurantiaca TaxID=3058365 RepID=A0ABT8F0S4_9BACT|nr:DUF3108 domain-containing protein [Shiella aurantiaca]MDN4163904.1 DUF3108 domain-containing protein [Shiella aurantiaca]